MFFHVVTFYMLSFLLSLLLFAVISPVFYFPENMTDSGAEGGKLCATGQSRHCAEMLLELDCEQIFQPVVIPTL
jgi:hypothetical protein